MKSRMIPVLCLLLLFLTACQKQTSDDPVVATYKDTQILQSEVAYEKENQINVTGDKTVSDADALDQILLKLFAPGHAKHHGKHKISQRVACHTISGFMIYHIDLNRCNRPQKRQRHRPSQICL